MTTAINHTEVHAKLAESYMIVKFEACLPPQNTGDAEETERLLNRTGAEGGTAKVSKPLWGPSKGHLMPELALIKGAMAKARNMHYDSTQTYAAHGTKNSAVGLLLKGNYLEYEARMAPFLADVERALVMLEPVYDYRVSDCRRSLGTMGPSTKYPTYEEFRARTKIELVPGKVPATLTSSDVDVLGDVAKQLVRTAEVNMHLEVEAAIKDAWGRVIAPVEWLIRQTSKEGNRLSTTMWANLQGVVDALKWMNINQDPQMEQVRLKLADLVATYPREEVRDNPRTRKQCNEDATKLLDDIGDALDCIGF